jgi:hypothetical protein
MDDLALTEPRLALLLDHFAAVKDVREPWRVVYPLREVLVLVVCATIANCDDYEDIVAWGEAHLDFLRRFSDFHHGVLRRGAARLRPHARAVSACARAGARDYRLGRDGQCHGTRKSAQGERTVAERWNEDAAPGRRRAFA